MKTIALLLVMTLLTGCGSSIHQDGKEIECYGLITEGEKKVPGIKYEQETGNVVWSVVTFGTIIIPVWLMGWKLYCPAEEQ